MENYGLINQLAQYLITGITVGSIYAIVGIGFNIIYNATEIINFAQGEFVMLGGLVMVTLVHTVHLPMPLAFLITIAIVTLVGLLMERLAIFPLKETSVMRLVIMTIALSILIKGLAMFVWGKNSFALKPFSGDTPLSLLGASIVPQTLWIIGITVLLVVLLSLFFGRTIIGKAMSACADNLEAASLVGINAQRMVMLSFMLSAGLGAVAGMIITPMALMEYDRGAMLALKGFGACILGGLGNFYGAVVAGILLGLIESYGAGLISSGYKDALALGALLLVLFIKPSGLLGSAEASKLKKF
ncbi:MAG: branched-chain amino acid ABC transporter permease [Deltaproteobacteria bacterium]|nr:branched-chain amino acid ABC transporter permease [Deltaproteobacteria bacterium]MBW2051519.1 branched-chain amino acid ABC transporter permease [Deltaproteobacteria bacterium]MBW2139739.1 branched-chain amino acid ABC transporter permease [Deltaproteobacteria bacterium]MBW2322509.1 branched-chain amino acid ABC transporter permease [Deltaproteobacteria bacterium]